DEHPVMVRQGNILATSFHPELTGDSRIHQLLLDLI
ncbi:MAG: pyridoxal 5'-phosphate synthase glutaminase subunit PdxT, partial [Acidimicrobiia bacterium]